MNEQLKPQMRGNTLYERGANPQEAVSTWNQITLYGTMSLKRRNQGHRNQEVEAGVAPFTIVTNDPWRALYSCPCNYALYRVKGPVI